MDEVERERIAKLLDRYFIYVMRVWPFLASDRRVDILQSVTTLPPLVILRIGSDSIGGLSTPEAERFQECLDELSNAHLK